MSKIQKVTIDVEYPASEVLNGNKTGMILVAQPKCECITSDADRATAPKSHDKSCFTRYIFGNTQGEIKPSFSIIKCSAKNPADLSGTPIVASLLAEPGFGASDGWVPCHFHSMCVLLSISRNVEGIGYRFRSKEDKTVMQSHPL